MKKLLPILLLATLCLGASAQEWREEKGDHFIVYYLNDSAQPKQIIRRAEFYYNRIADALGYARVSNFWQWDKRVKIYVHPTAQEFREATGQPEWSHGMASYFDKSIHTIETSDKFLESVLPHEIAHLIFRDFVGFRGQIPLWMDEGIAQWQEDSKRAEALKLMPDLLAAGNVFTLERMMRLDVRRESDPQRVALFYVQAVSLVDFLVGRYGPSAFTAFCRELRDGKSLEKALAAAYAGKIASIEEMEDLWREHVKGSRSEPEPAAAPSVFTS